MKLISSLPNAGAATTNRPDGVLTDDTSPGAGDGVPAREDWLNDIYYGMLAVMNDAGITADDSDEGVITSQFRDSITKMQIERSKPVGELFYMDDYKAPAGFNGSDPDSYFPALCLDNINGHEDITASHWPQWIDILRAKKFKYRSGTASEKSDFDVTNWAIVSNVATLTLANTASEIALITALAEDVVVHGAVYTNWRPVTLPSAIGDIPAGDYAITALSTVARTISFAFTHANGSGAVTEVANFYEHRIVGSTTTARVFEASGRTLIGPNDDNDECIPGLRRRQRMQGWQLGGTSTNNYFGILGSADNQQATVSYSTRAPLFMTESGQGSASLMTAVDDGTNGPPNTGKTTHGADIPSHLYIWGKRFVA